MRAPAAAGPGPHAIGRRGSFTGVWTMTAVNARSISRSTSTWVLGAVFALMALSAPILAHYMPEIVSAMVDPGVAQALSQGMGDPSWTDAYAGWTKNLNQTCVFALIVIASTSMHSHLHGGMAPIILARNIGRSAYLGAHLLAFHAVTLLLLLSSALAVWVTTVLLFHDAHSRSAPLPPVMEATLVWWLISVLLVSVIALVESATMKLGISLGSGICAYLLMTVGAMWAWGGDHTPLGLLAVMNGAASHQGGAPVALPVGGTIALVVALTAACLAIFDRRNLD